MNSIIIYTIVTTHLTSTITSIYLHRGLTHKNFKFNIVVEHFFRFWLWLTDGVNMKNWVAQHRKHHRFTDVEGDPHSPVLFGIKKIAFGGFMQTLLYRYEYRFPDTQKTNELYGFGTPDDWLERNIYNKQYLGLALLLVIDVLLFGWYGLLVWLIQISWMPLWSALVVTGFAHWWGYRDPKSKDNSRNLIFPLGFFLAGDHLHNNHHMYPAEPKLSRRWFEFDLGWTYVRILEILKLAKINS